MTIPALDRLKHKWDPAFGAGDFVQDVISGAHALKGDAELSYPKQFYEARLVNFEDRSRPPSNSTRRRSRDFRGSDPDWVDAFPQSTHQFLTGTSGKGGWGYGGVLEIQPAFATFTEGMTTDSLVTTFNADGDAWIYVDLWYRHEYLMPHSSGLNTIGRIKLDGEDALIINLIGRGNVWDGADDELMLNILQPDYTPYTMNLQPSDVDQQRPFNRWTENRIQVIAKRGGTGELHVWLNDVKIAEHTAVLTLDGEAWDEVELGFQWGDTLGATLYADALDPPGPNTDEHNYSFIDIRTLDAMPVWYNQPLHGNEPTNYTKLILDPGSNGKTFIANTNLWDTGYMSATIGGRVDNLTNTPPSGHYGWGFGTVSTCFASPLKFVTDPHWLLGSAHYEGIALAGIASQIGESFGEHWDHRQWGWGARFQLARDNCRAAYANREDIYVCAYFSLGAEYEIPQYSPPNDSLAPYIIGIKDESGFWSTVHSTDRGVAIDITSARLDPPRLYFNCGFGGSTSSRVVLERDRIYKVEVLLTNTIHEGSPIVSTASWWVDGVLIDSGLNVTTTGNGVAGIQWIHKYSWDSVAGNIETLAREQNARLYYMYVSTPDETLQNYREPVDAALPARLELTAIDGAGKVTNYGHRHLKIPVGDDQFYVGDDLSEYTFAFVFRHRSAEEYGTNSQYLLDSWHELFGGFLPSIVLGPEDRPAKGYGVASNSTTGENSTKIQLNWRGSSFVTLGDRPLDTDWHSLVFSFSQYGTCHVRCWLDGVKIYDAYPNTNQGRWYARRFPGDGQKQYVTLFTSCDAGEWWRQQEQGSDQHDIYTEDCGDNSWGNFCGEAGPVFFWDRQLMYNEILQLVEDLRVDYTTIPASGPPTTNTLSAPTTVAVVPDQGILKATWDDVVDPSGFEVRFEVEISDDSGASWSSLRTLSDGEPGGIPQLYFSARPFPSGTGYRIRVRGFNGVNFSPWGESADFEVSEWAAFLIQTPTRDGNWFDGDTEYPGTRLARGAFCLAGNTIARGDPGYPGTLAGNPNDFYYYEAPPGKAIERIHFYDFKINRDTDWTNLWGYNPTDGWFNYMDVRHEREEGFVLVDYLNQGWWGQHWVDIRYWVDQGWVSEETTRIAFDLQPYEHNSWYQDRGSIGFAVDAVELTDGEIDNPEEPEEPVEPSVGSPCAEYQECWLARPNLLDLETYFIPGDTHLYARTLFGLAAGVTVDSATFRILEYEGGPAIVNSLATVVNIGDGSADLTYQLTQANTTSIGAEDARPYQLIVTLSDNNVYTVNAGIIKASAPASIPAP